MSADSNESFNSIFEDEYKRKRNKAPGTFESPDFFVYLPKAKFT